MCMLEIGRENYITSIMNAYHIHDKAKAPERKQRIAQACASYAARDAVSNLIHTRAMKHMSHTTEK